MDPTSKIFSIGHSNQTAEGFLRLLQLHRIELLVDVRSKPYSKYDPQFKEPAIKAMVIAAGIQYLFLGRELGGRPDSKEFYDEKRHVLYGLLAESPLFLKGIERIKAESRLQRTAIMCSEENPLRCHRQSLIAPILAEHGVSLLHIRGDGRLETEADLESEIVSKQDQQLLLFTEDKDQSWKSSRSVSLKRAPRSFLEF